MKSAVLVDLFLKMAQASVTYTIDCTAPVADNFFKMSEFIEYMKKHMKVNGLRNNLGDKVTFEDKDKKLSLTSSTKTTKRALRYYARKFLKKMELRERFRVVSVSKSDYEFRPYRVDKEE